MPAFMPVGTQGSVKAVSPRELREMGAHFVVLDECAPYPCDYEYAARSAEMTTRWAKGRKTNIQRSTFTFQPPTLNGGSTRLRIAPSALEMEVFQLATPKPTRYRIVITLPCHLD